MLHIHVYVYTYTDKRNLIKDTRTMRYLVCASCHILSHFNLNVSYKEDETSIKLNSCPVEIPKLRVLHEILTKFTLKSNNLTQSNEPVQITLPEYVDSTKKSTLTLYFILTSCLRGIIWEFQIADTVFGDRIFLVCSTGRHSVTIS